MKALTTLVSALVLLCITAETEAGKRHGKAESRDSAQSTVAQSTAGHPRLTQGKSKPPVQLVGMSRVPKFGFHSSFGWAADVLGEHVTRVNFGTPADRLGIEPGDSIVAVNGQQLRTANCWYNAINRAANHDGWVTLKIRCARTGKMAYRTANLFRLHGK